tara:strand:+ start:1992 stop:2237 length:246 start_codon:yes stop_codon:yes gene_type:complete
LANIETEIVWTGDKDRAESLLSSIKPDDEGFFDAEILDGDNGEVILRIEINGDTLRSVRSTVDDLLACLSAAESSLNALEE